MKTAVKRGMASLYLVAFTTLLLGIVTMSFARVMISEKKEASNSDLSQSAFDSALAGIEDAKTTIIMYESCLNKSDNETAGGNGISCGNIRKLMTEGFNTGNCDVVQKILYGENSTGEVVVSEKLDQYYTCVPIANDAPTYQSVLNEDNRSRIIPVKVEKDSSGNSQHDKIAGIELQWFTPESDSDADADIKYMITDTDRENNYIPLRSKSAAMDELNQKSAPILTFELFQTDEEFTMAELDLNNEDNSGTDHAMIMLYPDGTTAGDFGTFVSSRNLLDASNKSSQAALTAAGNYQDSIVPKLVSCGYDDGGARCRATIEFPPTYKKKTRAEQTFMFRVSLPYGTPQTDFSIKPCTKIDQTAKHCTEYANFTGTQYIVDSTGRASTLYRRIIARIETTPKFIFPEYAVQVSGNNSTIEKDFYVTENCWMSDGKGNYTTCANNGEAN